MRPGRLPEDHPLERQARDELREKQGTKPDPPAEGWQAHLTDDPSLRAQYVDQDLSRWTTDPPPQPTRWGS